MPRSCTPSLVSHARLKFDGARNGPVLLLPERVVKLSESAAAILELCDGTRSIGEIERVLKQQFHHGTIQCDVSEFLSEFKQRGWITVGDD